MNTTRLNRPDRPQTDCPSWAKKPGICLAAALLLCVNATAQWLNALKPSGQPACELMLVQNGMPQAGIVVDEHPTTEENKAARDLQMWIREITGATLPVQAGVGGERKIFIRTDAGLGNDGYSIESDGGSIMLKGGSRRGVVNAVYALLEEDLGCRFYTLESIRIPKTNTLVIAPVARRYVPQLKLRDPYYACAFDAEWSLRNRTAAPDAKVPAEYGGYPSYDGMFVHTISKIIPVEKFFTNHPEYFALQKDGKRSAEQVCATEPAVARLTIDFVRQVLKDNPETSIISVSKNDNPIECHCERCEKIRAAEGSDMANQLVLVNQVAEAIEKDFPDVTIDTLAYQVTIGVPQTMRPRKNVAIRLCSDRTGSWRHPFTPAEQLEIGKLCAAWSAVHDRIYIWDYNVNFSHYLAPMPNLDVMAANIRFWIKNHAEGVMLQGGYQGPAERDELKSWVAAKLLWNPAWDEKALTQDFIWGHYGKAAPMLADYDALLNHMRVDFADQMASPTNGIRYKMDSPFFTKEFIRLATEIFARAKEAAKGDDVLTRRVERAQLPVLYVQCVRGPEFVGAGYAQVVEDFERIARRENVQRLREGGPDFETKLAKYKEQISTSTSK